jgi:hypothetical protein
VYWIDLALGWQAALTAQRVRELRNKRNLLTPFTPSPAQSNVTLATHDAKE